jgi:hypothetical protein
MFAGKYRVLPPVIELGPWSGQARYDTGEGVVTRIRPFYRLSRKSPYKDDNEFRILISDLESNLKA